MEWKVAEVCPNYFFLKLQLKISIFRQFKFLNQILDFWQPFLCFWFIVIIIDSKYSYFYCQILILWLKIFSTYSSYLLKFALIEWIVRIADHEFRKLAKSTPKRGIFYVITIWVSRFGSSGYFGSLIKNFGNFYLKNLCFTLELTKRTPKKGIFAIFVLTMSRFGLVYVFWVADRKFRGLFCDKLLLNL